MTRISVLMPVYNGERFLKPALDSLLNQSFQDWELIVINDGSIDHTKEILDSYTDPRFHVFDQPNSGEAAARNAALEKAGSEYISFLDADDMYLPNALQDMIQYLDEHLEYDCAFCDGFFCDENNQKMDRLTEIRPGIFTGDILEPLVLDPAVLTVPVCTITRRHKIVDLGLKFDKNLVIGPDWDFWIHLARFAKFGYLDRTTCMYRVHQTNITRKSGLEKRKRDLAYGRRKILNSSWFNNFSLETKKQFFENFLFQILDFSIEERKTVLISNQFASLPSYFQADCWRRHGILALQKENDFSEFRASLLQSLKISPEGRKTQILYLLSRFGTKFSLKIVDFWQTIDRLRKSIKSFGKKKPKSVPKALTPIGK